MNENIEIMENSAIEVYATLQLVHGKEKAKEMFHNFLKYIKKQIVSMPES